MKPEEKVILHDKLLKILKKMYRTVLYEQVASLCKYFCMARRLIDEVIHVPC